MEKSAIVLLSGGLDSATCLYIAQKEKKYKSIFALSFDYGQRHSIEKKCAINIAKSLGIEQHFWISFDLRQFGGSALTDDIDVPKNSLEENNPNIIPITYVPARNTIFLSFAASLAESKKCDDIYIGVNALDYSGYPDCRPEYIEAFQNTLNLGTKTGIEGKASKIQTPLISMSKADIIKKAYSLGLDFSMTNSCYDPDEAGRSCGECEACALRLKGFSEAGLVDTAVYI